MRVITWLVANRCQPLIITWTKLRAENDEHFQVHVPDENSLANHITGTLSHLIIHCSRNDELSFHLLNLISLDMSRLVSWN